MKNLFEYLIAIVFAVLLVITIYQPIRSRLLQLVDNSMSDVRAHSKSF